MSEFSDADSGAVRLISHAPAAYDCPFCRLVRGDVTAAGTGPEDIVYRDEGVTAFLSLHWRENNPGHVLVVPNAHIEHVYAMPDALGEPLQRAVRRVALAMKQAYGCTGISTAQHNEPHGNQDVWHFHTHVFPRYEGDHLYRSRLRLTTREERQPYAEQLRAALAAGDQRGATDS